MGGLRVHDHVPGGHDGRRVPGSLAGILVMYAVLGAATYGIIRGMARRWQREEPGEQDVPYGPATPTHPDHDQVSS